MLIIAGVGFWPYNKVNIHRTYFVLTQRRRRDKKRILCLRFYLGQNSSNDCRSHASPQTLPYNRHSGR
jgi:hypothetical protein